MWGLQWQNSCNSTYYSSVAQPGVYFVGFLCYPVFPRMTLSSRKPTTPQHPLPPEQVPIRAWSCFWSFTVRAQTSCACGTGLGAANPKGGAGAAANPKGAGAGAAGAAAGAGAAGAAAGAGAAGVGAAGAAAGVGAGAAGVGAFSAFLGSATGIKACCLNSRTGRLVFSGEIPCACASGSAHNQEGKDGGLGLEGLLPNKKNQLIQPHTSWCPNITADSIKSSWSFQLNWKIVVKMGISCN